MTESHEIRCNAMITKLSPRHDLPFDYGYKDPYLEECFDSDIARNILELKRKGYTGDYLSGLLGVRKLTLTGWFRHGVKPTADNLKKLNKLFKELL